MSKPLFITRPQYWGAGLGWVGISRGKLFSLPNLYPTIPGSQVPQLAPRPIATRCAYLFK